MKTLVVSQSLKWGGIRACPGTNSTALKLWVELGVGCEGSSWAGQNDGIHGGWLCVTLLALAKPVGLRARCSQGHHRQWQALFCSQSWEWLLSLQRGAFFWTWGMGGRFCPPAIGRTDSTGNATWQGWSSEQSPFYLGGMSVFPGLCFQAQMFPVPDHHNGTEDSFFPNTPTPIPEEFLSFAAETTKAWPKSLIFRPWALRCLDGLFPVMVFWILLVQQQ